MEPTGRFGFQAQRTQVEAGHLEDRVDLDVGGGQAGLEPLAVKANGDGGETAALSQYLTLGAGQAESDPTRGLLKVKKVKPAIFC